MPHGSRLAVLFAVGMAAASTPLVTAQGQTGDRSRSAVQGDLTSGLARPDRSPPPRFPEPRRGLPPQPSPWSATPAPGARPSPGGITQREAMDLLSAAGFTDIAPPEPNSDGSWTGYASRQGRTVRARVDPRGGVSSR